MIKTELIKEATEKLAGGEELVAEPFNEELATGPLKTEELASEAVPVAAPGDMTMASGPRMNAALRAKMRSLQAPAQPLVGTAAPVAAPMGLPKRPPLAAAAPRGNVRGLPLRNAGLGALLPLQGLLAK
jgi:hypothetical protein